jgi:hypothetical protein
VDAVCSVLRCHGARRSALAVLVLDAGIGKVYMLVEVRQVVLARPSRDLFGLTIRVEPVETLVLD